MQLSTYFARIGIQSVSGPASASNLARIVSAHIYAIPFENLSVFLDGQVNLEVPAIMSKLVDQQRGGWCFEQNGLLAAVLKELGYPLRTIMARSLLAPDRPRTHQILIVQADGQDWLVDAGFGGVLPRGPIPFPDRNGGQVEMEQDGLTFRLCHHAGSVSPSGEPGYFILQYAHQKGWKDLYTFSPETWIQADFLTANHFHRSSGLSAFTANRVVTKLIQGGRVTLVDRSWKRFRNSPAGEILEAEGDCATVEAYDALLRSDFGIPLDTAALERLFGFVPAIYRL